jgi:hypothetical protein
MFFIFVYLFFRKFLQPLVSLQDAILITIILENLLGQQQLNIVQQKMQRKP